MPRRGGEAGRRKISQYTRYATVVLAIFQGALIMKMLTTMGAVDEHVFAPMFYVESIATLTAGAATGPQGLALDQFGNVYVADTANSRIALVTQTTTSVDFGNVQQYQKGSLTPVPVSNFGNDGPTKTTRRHPTDPRFQFRKRRTYSTASPRRGS